MDDTKTVMCDGASDDEMLGHPRIYLQITPNSIVICPYCGKEFGYEQG